MNSKVKEGASLLWLLLVRDTTTSQSATPENLSSEARYWEVFPHRTVLLELSWGEGESSRKDCWRHFPRTPGGGGVSWVLKRFGGFRTICQRYIGESHYIGLPGILKLAT